MKRQTPLQDPACLCKRHSFGRWTIRADVESWGSRPRCSVGHTLSLPGLTTSRPQHTTVKRRLPLQASSSEFSNRRTPAIPCRSSYLKSSVHAVVHPKAHLLSSPYPAIAKLGVRRRQGWAGGMSEPATQCRGSDVGSGEGGMRTVECLRGRLLAERVASKAAKEEADQLANRLDELEKKLADEVKIRNKAERRLRRAIKRMESLKIIDVQLSLSENSIGSLSSSSNACSGQQAPEMQERNDPAGSLTSTVDSVGSAPRAGGEDKGWDGDSAKGSSAGSCTLANSSSQDGSWFSVVSEQSGSGLCKEEGPMSPDGAKNCDCSGGSAAGDVGHDSQRESEQPTASSGSSKSEASYRDEEDDRLALVLVDNPHYTAEDSVRADNEEREAESNKLAVVLADPQPQPAMSGGNDVQSVLLALRRVKEQLRYTIERRSEGLVAHRELCSY